MCNRMLQVRLYKAHKSAKQFSMETVSRSLTKFAIMLLDNGNKLLYYQFDYEVYFRSFENSSLTPQHDPNSMHAGEILTPQALDASLMMEVNFLYNTPFSDTDDMYGSPTPSAEVSPVKVVARKSIDNSQSAAIGVAMTAEALEDTISPKGHIDMHFNHASESHLLDTPFSSQDDINLRMLERYSFEDGSVVLMTKTFAMRGSSANAAAPSASTSSNDSPGKTMNLAPAVATSTKPADAAPVKDDDSKAAIVVQETILNSNSGSSSSISKHLSITSTSTSFIQQQAKEILETSIDHEEADDQHDDMDSHVYDDDILDDKHLHSALEDISMNTSIRTTDGDNYFDMIEKEMKLRLEVVDDADIISNSDEPSSPYSSSSSAMLHLSSSATTPRRNQRDSPTDFGMAVIDEHDSYAPTLVDEEEFSHPHTVNMDIINALDDLPGTADVYENDSDLDDESSIDAVTKSSYDQDDEAMSFGMNDVYSYAGEDGADDRVSGSLNQSHRSSLRNALSSSSVVANTIEPPSEASTSPAIGLEQLDSANSHQDVNKDHFADLNTNSKIADHVDNASWSNDTFTSQVQEGAENIRSISMETGPSSAIDLVGSNSIETYDMTIPQALLLDIDIPANTSPKLTSDGPQATFIADVYDNLSELSSDQPHPDVALSDSMNEKPLEAVDAYIAEIPSAEGAHDAEEQPSRSNLDDHDDDNKALDQSMESTAFGMSAIYDDDHDHRDEALRFVDRSFLNERSSSTIIDNESTSKSDQDVESFVHQVDADSDILPVSIETNSAPASTVQASCLIDIVSAQALLNAAMPFYDDGIDDQEQSYTDDADVSKNTSTLSESLSLDDSKHDENVTDESSGLAVHNICDDKSNGIADSGLYEHQHIHRSVPIPFPEADIPTDRVEEQQVDDTVQDKAKYDQYQTISTEPIADHLDNVTNAEISDLEVAMETIDHREETADDAIAHNEQGHTPALNHFLDKSSTAVELESPQLPFDEMLQVSSANDDNDAVDIHADHIKLLQSQPLLDIAKTPDTGYHPHPQQVSDDEALEFSMHEVYSDNEDIVDNIGEHNASIKRQSEVTKNDGKHNLSTDDDRIIIPGTLHNADVTCIKSEDVTKAAADHDDDTPPLINNSSDEASSACDPDNSNSDDRSIPLITDSLIPLVSSDPLDVDDKRSIAETLADQQTSTNNESEDLYAYEVPINLEAQSDSTKEEPDHELDHMTVDKSDVVDVNLAAELDCDRCHELETAEFSMHDVYIAEGGDEETITHDNNENNRSMLRRSMISASMTNMTEVEAEFESTVKSLAGDHQPSSSPSDEDAHGDEESKQDLPRFDEIYEHESDLEGGNPHHSLAEGIDELVLEATAEAAAFAMDDVYQAEYQKDELIANHDLNKNDRSVLRRSMISAANSMFIDESEPVVEELPNIGDVYEKDSDSDIEEEGNPRYTIVGNDLDKEAAVFAMDEVYERDAEEKDSLANHHLDENDRSVLRRSMTSSSSAIIASTSEEELDEPPRDETGKSSTNMDRAESPREDAVVESVLATDESSTAMETITSPTTSTVTAAYDGDVLNPIHEQSQKHENATVVVHAKDEDETEASSMSEVALDNPMEIDMRAISTAVNPMLLHSIIAATADADTLSSEEQKHRAEEEVIKKKNERCMKRCFCL
jgi:hypothetical protein